jgi:hypothetical protein
MRDDCTHILGFPSAFVVRAFRFTHTSKIEAEHCGTCVIHRPSYRCDDLIVHRTAEKGVRVGHDRNGPRAHLHRQMRRHLYAADGTGDYIALTRNEGSHWH